MNSRSVMPLSFMRWPAKTKNGTASSGKLWLMVAIFCTAIDIGMPPSVAKKMKPEMPMANATGAPISMSTKKSMVMRAMAQSSLTVEYSVSERV